MATTKKKIQLLRAWFSPYSQRVELALAWKGIDYDLIEENLLNKSPLLLSSNPVYHKIPVFFHGDLPPLCESCIIVQYIDETWPLPHRNLLPSDPHSRAMARFWADFVDNKLLDAMVRILKKEGEEQKAAIKEAKEYLRIVEEELQKREKGPFFGGAEVGYVDMILGPFVAWRQGFEAVAGEEFPLEQQYPRLHAWFSAFRQSAIATVLPEADKVTEFVVDVARKHFVPDNK